MITTLYSIRDSLQYLWSSLSGEFLYGLIICNLCDCLWCTFNGFHSVSDKLWFMTNNSMIFTSELHWRKCQKGDMKNSSFNRVKGMTSSLVLAKKQPVESEDNFSGWNKLLWFISLVSFLYGEQRRRIISFVELYQSTDV